ncbi:unnamed protein product [Orchesella dallaii]|uniref:CUB domain-containing protein n=1 Tax=Orchesella dallaii TaxID=48710 RepID=A0ABP1R707_9HEXA
MQEMDINMASILQNVHYCGSETPPDFFTVARSAELVFHTGDTESGSTRKGFKIGYKIAVLDGSPSGIVLAQYCGTTIPNPVFSNSNILYVKFFTRMYPVDGYDITYTTTDVGRGCGGSIFHTGGSFTSPLYPGNYSVNMDYFAFGGGCSADFLEILSMDSQDDSGSAILFSRYCAGDVPARYTGTTDMAIIRYKTSRNNSGSGWRAVFKGVQPTSVQINSQV